MPTINFPICSLHLHLDGGLTLCEALGLPDISRLARKSEKASEKLTQNVANLLPTLSHIELHRLSAAASVEVHSVEVELAAPPKFPAWRGAIKLSFPFVRWRHGEHAHLAFVPALGLQVIANKADELDESLSSEIIAALQRSRRSSSLRSLVEVQSIARVECEPVKVSAEITSPKRRAIEARRETRQKKSILDQVGVNLGKAANPAAYRMQATVDRLAEALTGKNTRSILLVGPSGVGKTAAFRQLVRERKNRRLGATPFYMTSGSKLVAGQCGYGMWQQRCRDVCREAAKVKAVLHLGNLVELMDVGKSEGNPSGIASFLRPYIARGELLAVAECTPEQLPIIEREDPQLIDAFQTLHVAEPSAEDVRTILQLFAYDQPPRLRQSLSGEVLEAIERLHRRYATYSAFPGRPLRFLQGLLNDSVSSPTPTAPAPGRESRRRRKKTRTRARPAEAPASPPRPITLANVYEAFSRETGLPRVLLDPAVRLDLEAARVWFGRRVIGQGEAVNLITDVIGTVKAALSRPDRPIASLMFIGPTGVGKTEMAKALAEYLFGSAQRLTRFDMSEYGDPIAVQRLVGTAFGAEGLLTAKVREQPFSVILLDEFEKAHSAFFDLLLQMLGEGRLTDAAGRLADFRNSVIILTSNLGAESYQLGKVGFQGANPQTARGDAVEHFTREVRDFLRPEMFNRIDRIVAFSPLPADVVRRIADRQLQLIRDRDGVRYRGLDLQVDEAVADYLAAIGFDGRYGARPLKRAIERQLLAPLAAHVNEYSAANAIMARATLVDGRLNVVVKPRLDSFGRPISAQASLPDAVRAAHDCVDLRRLFQRIERCWAAQEFRNELFQLDRREKHWLRLLEWAAVHRPDKKPKNPLSPAEQSNLVHLRELAEALDAQSALCRLLEDDALIALHSSPPGPASAPLDAAAITARLKPIRNAWWGLLRTLYCRRFPDSDIITMCISSEERQALFELTRAYVQIVENHRWEFSLQRYQAMDRPIKLDQPDLLLATIFGQGECVWYKDMLVNRQTRQAILQRINIARPLDYLSEPDQKTLAFGLEIRGPAVFPGFVSEEGTHDFEFAKQKERVRVETSALEVDKYQPPEAITRRGALEPLPRRRFYDMIQRMLHDPKATEPRWSASEGFTANLDQVLQETMKTKMLDMLDE